MTAITTGSMKENDESNHATTSLLNVDKATAPLMIAISVINI